MGFGRALKLFAVCANMLWLSVWLTSIVHDCSDDLPAGFDIGVALTIIAATILLLVRLRAGAVVTATYYFAHAIYLLYVIATDQHPAEAAAVLVLIAVPYIVTGACVAILAWLFRRALHDKAAVSERATGTSQAGC